MVDKQVRGSDVFEGTVSNEVRGEDIGELR